MSGFFHNQHIKQAVVTNQPNLLSDRNTMRLSLFNEDGTPYASGSAGPVAWADITGKPATFPPVVSTTAPAALATTAAVGTSTSAARGDHAHALPTGAVVALTGYAIGTPGALAATDKLNAALGKLEARLAALESV